MFFTRAGRIVAWLAIILGGIRIATAILVLMTDDPSAAAPMILGSKSIGQAINQGLYAAIIGIVVGVLTDISRSVANTTGTQS